MLCLTFFSYTIKAIFAINLMAIFCLVTLIQHIRSEMVTNRTHSSCSRDITYLDFIGYAKLVHVDEDLMVRVGELVSKKRTIDDDVEVGFFGDHCVRS